MDILTDRRSFLRGGLVGILSTGSLVAGVRPARAAETTELSGRLTAESGGTIDNDEVNVHDGDEFHSVNTDAEGRFEIPAPTYSRTSISFYKADERSDFEALRNGVPHIYELGPFEIGEEPKDIGTVTLPKAHLVDVRVLKPNGDPLMGANPGFRYNGWGSNPSRVALNTDGYVVIEGASFTGAEFADHVTIEVEPPQGEEYSDTSYTRQVPVEGPTEVVAVIDSNGVSWQVDEPTSSTTISAAQQTTPQPTSSPAIATTGTRQRTPTATATPSTAVDETTDQSSTEQRQRGFFSSTGDEPEFLSDIMNLTVMGFILSIAGLFQQLVRGK